MEVIKLGAGTPGKKLRVAIIDADLIGRKEHRFPNLACMKLSGYHKKLGHSVKLIHYDEISPNSLFPMEYDKVLISKVFTETYIPDNILSLENVEYGGTGFFFDKAPGLPYEIEHSFPDYNLYTDWVEERWSAVHRPENYFKYFRDYSVGFSTRGCVRGCSFCVNKNSKEIKNHSPFKEFVDVSRPKICMLDDNILGSKNWKEIFEELILYDKRIQYNQGMDVRFLTEEKALMLKNVKYDEDMTFAFDKLKDKPLIIRKLNLLRKHMPTKMVKLYVFCAFDEEDKYPDDFWGKDIRGILERVKVLKSYKTHAYLMKFIKWKEAPMVYSKMYSMLGAYINNPALLKTKTLREFIDLNVTNKKWIYQFEQLHPDIVEDFFFNRYADGFEERMAVIEDMRKKENEEKKKKAEELEL